MKWNVIYTKSRSEKAVAEKLLLAGIDVYCPLLKTRKLWSDRWKWVEEPLFRSYCFVRIEEKDREKVLFIPGVIKYVFHCGKPAGIRDNEMNVLKDWLQIFKHDTLQARNFSVNDRIRVKSGALINKEAAIVETKGNFATLLLEDLGIEVKVDLRNNLVEKI